MRHVRSLLVTSLLACPVVHAQPSRNADREAGRPPRATSPGVSLALARERRAGVSDVRYALSLAVDTGDVARGTVTITFTQRAPGSTILDFRGLALGTVEINGRPWPRAARAWTGHHLPLPAQWLRPGRNQVTLAFTTRSAAAGSAIIRTRDVTDGQVYLYTLLVPSDAQLLFPVFDQPDLKARVTLSLTTPAGWRALANGRPVRQDTTAETITHRFAETPPLSTYLIAFAAGPWAVRTRDEAIVEGRTPTTLSLYVRQSRVAEAEADTLLAMNARALRWLGSYFGVPYAFGKYDALLAPAFPFGGMEHPGAVFYNEDSFIYREPPTTAQLLGRQATTFHEVAHQWFGDYVTMRWFDDLWLKEGFATFMAARMQSELEPASQAWKTFYLRNKPVAYATDATLGTTPIWQQLENLDQAKSNYGPIVYNKAPAVLRQLEYTVGPTAFRRGVQRFLARHPYGNATWPALVQAIGEAAGRDLSAWGRAWMLRPGMPVVTQEVRVANGRIRRLRLHQRPAQPARSGPGAWPLAMEVLLAYPDGRSERLPVRWSGTTTDVLAARGRPAPAYVFANAGDYGYAIVLPDSASVAYLETHISEVPDALLRAMLWGALWDLVRDARLAPSRYAAMVRRALPLERDEQLAGTLISRLVTAVTRYAEPTAGAELLEAVEALLHDGASRETSGYGMRKAHLDAYIGLARSPDAVDRLRGWLGSERAAGLPLRAPTRWAIVSRLIARGAPDADALIAEERRRDTSADGARQAFAVSAATPDAKAKAALFTRWFADSTLNEEWVTGSLRAFHDPEVAELTRPLLLPALDTLPWIQRNRRIFFLGSWLSATLGGQRDADALTAVDAWLNRRPDLATDLRLKVLQARDELERTVRIRQRFAPPTP